jgi:hypothetical protein
MDTMSALVLHNLFGRHAGVRVLCIESGSNWVPYLLGRMDFAVDTALQMGNDVEAHRAVPVRGRAPAVRGRRD